MATAPTRRVISRTPPRAARTRSGFAAECRWCKRPILWLRSISTDVIAPIDATPAPGGNIVVHRDEFATALGTYDVDAPPRQSRAPQQEALLEREDPYADLGGGLDDLELSDADRPTKHYNHWVTCSSATARRLARERAAAGGGPPGPLRTIDGDPIGSRHARPEEPDAFAPPPAVAAFLRRCRGCWQPMDADLSAAGARYHANCEPDPGPEPDRT